MTTTATAFTIIIFMTSTMITFFLVIGNFGHCNQELINLLLVGQATSNVFDGEVPIGDSTTTTGGNSGGSSGNSSGGDSMMLKGTPHRSEIGYLSQLEALRYCQVMM